MLSTTLQPQTSPKITTDITVSIIIVNYNGAAYLGNCLESLQRSLLPDCEIILVDNASTDESLRLVRERFPQVSLLPSDHNLGFGGGNNLGARCARGQYLVFLNPDTTVEPGWLEVLIKTLDDHPRAALVTSKVMQMEEPDKISACGNEMHITGLTLGRGMGQPRNTFDQVEEVTAVSGASFCVKQDVFDHLGRFDDSFFLYMEDSDLSLRARLAGFCCLHAPQSVIYHDYTLSIDARKTFYQEFNRYQMLLKNLRWPTLIILLPALLLSELITWGFVLLKDRKHWDNKVRAYFKIVRTWGEIMQRRRAIQSLRCVRDRELVLPLASQIPFEQTGEGIITWSAHIVFDSLFLILKKIYFLILWW
jgi:GT2 family glycosyltransferase